VASEHDAAGSEQDEARSYLQRAELLNDLGRYDEAIEEVRHALALNPEYADAHAMLALLQFHAKRYEEAIEPAEAALTIDPEHLAAHIVRGHALAALRRTEAALSAAEDLFRQDPESWLVNAEYAAILRQVRNGQPALDAAWRAVRLAPEEPRAHHVLALVAGDLGLTELAERARSEAARLQLESKSADQDLGSLAGFSPGSNLIDELHNSDPTDEVLRYMLLGTFGPVVQIGAGYAVLSPVLVACGGPGTILSRAVALVLVIAGVAGGLHLTRRLPGSVTAMVRKLGRVDVWLTRAVYAVAVAPLALLIYVLLPGPWPLALSVIAGLFAGTALMMRVDPPLGPGEQDSDRTGRHPYWW